MPSPQQSPPTWPSRIQLCGNQPGDARALADAVLGLAGRSHAERQRLGRNAREYLLADFEEQAVIDGYERILVDLGRGQRRGAPAEGRA
jgi:hypothetical protein